MRHFAVFLLGLLMLACQSSPQKQKTVTPADVAQAVAIHYGYNNWDTVTSLQFSFNVKKDSISVTRSYRWFPKENRVVYSDIQDTIAFLHPNSDSLFTTLDKKFINDKYWLLAPYHLIWDANLKYSLATDIAPISGKELQKLSVQYPAEGGYTPGDAYDFYLEEAEIIEWSYRKGGQAAPTLTTTWEKTIAMEGLRLCTHHTDSTGTFNLFFTDLKIN